MDNQKPHHAGPRAASGGRASIHAVLLHRKPPIMLALLLLTLAALSSQPLPAAGNQLEITLDAREAPRGLLRSELTFPVDPGPLTLQYPKWIPGEHGPTGPVRDVVDLRMNAGGRELDWQRDPRDLYIFRTVIPPGAKSLRVEFNFLLPTEQRGFSAGRSATDNLAVLSWHYVLLYPAGTSASRLQARAALLLPEGWSFGTALRREARDERDARDDRAAGDSSNSRDSRGPGAIRFAEVPLATLVDSPVLAGRHFRSYALMDNAGRRSSQAADFHLHIAADSDAALEFSAETRQSYSRLVREVLALFGSRPFAKYDFLMALSDHIAQFGLEHHESSDNRLGERMLLTDGGRRGAAGMLAHELVHAWNGKARRPAEMILDDFQQPQATEMLWVYEGLTDYFESVIPVRAGLWAEQDWRDQLAFTAANQAALAGRKWRSLADTSSAAQLQFEAPSAGSDRRRTIDFYQEADLIWLEADVTIRSLTGGRRSLDDFCREFFGKPAAGLRTPRASGYRYRELIEALDGVASYDWDGFFRARVYRPAPQAPLGGIEKSGWRLAFRDEFPHRYRAYEESSGNSDFRHSVGLILRRESGGGAVMVEEVLVDSPAYKAGVIAGMKMVGVNVGGTGGGFSPDRLREAIRAAHSSPQPIEIQVERDGQLRTLPLDYHDGERYPYLERNPDLPDVLYEITRPLAE